MENKLKDSKTAVIEYFATDDISGKTVEKGEFSREFQGREKKEEILEIKNTQKGTFTLNVNITAKDESGEDDTNELSLEYSVMDRYKDGEKLNYELGCSGHLSYKNRNAEEQGEILTAAGMGIWRDEYQWHDVETTKGSLKKVDLLDRYVTYYNSKGIENLTIAAYGNLNYMWNTGVVPSTNAGIAAYAKYAAFLAKEYKNEIQAIEIWNEYNYKLFNLDGADSENYVKMLKACYKAIKEVNPDIKVVGISSADIDIEFIKEVFANGGYDYMDVVSTHPYNKVEKQQFDDQKWLKSVMEVKDLMNQYGGGKELWFTEMGWSTYTDSAGEYHITEEQQAKYLTRFYVLSKANEIGEKIFIYDFEENYLSPTESEGHFGIVRNVNYHVPYAAKPAIPAICAMNRFIGNSGYKDSVYFNEKTSAHRFIDRDNAEQTVMIWSSGEDSVALGLGTKEIELYDLCGNKLNTIKSNDGIYQFDLNDEQYYIKGNFEFLKEEEPDITVTYPTNIVTGDVFTIKCEDKKQRDLKIEIDCGEELMVEENDGFKHGKGEVLVKVPSNADDAQNIDLIFYDGDNIVMQARYPKTMVSTVDCNFEWNVVKGSQRRCRLENVIHNNSNNRTISGSCEIIEPKELAQNSKVMKFYNIRPGNTATLPINLPEQFTIKSRDITVRCILDDGTTMETTKHISTVPAQKIEKPPIIDGVIDRDEWNGNVFEASDKENSYSMSGVWGCPEDTSFIGQVMYDDENLYLAFTVKDDVFSQNKTDANIWNGDCVQVGFVSTENESKSITSFTEIAAALTQNGPIVWRYNSDCGQPSGKIEKAEAAIKRVKNNTVYEIKLPINEVFGDDFEIKENLEVPFSAVANDADKNDRKGWIEFNSGIALAKDSSLFGTLRFTN